MGITLNAYLRKIRLSNAAMQLVSTNKNVTEISLDSGFKSITTFLREFKKEYGTSPSDMRRIAEKNWQRAPIKRGAKHLETAVISLNCVQGGAKRNSPVASQWFERLKIVPEMQKIAWFQAIFLVSTLLLTYGSRNWARTSDPLINSQMLCHTSTNTT